MAIFRAGVEAASPLLYQLEALVDTPLVVVGFTAQGTTDVGSTSRPNIYYPSTRGEGIVPTPVQCLDLPGKVSRAFFYSQFAIPPTTPVVATTTSNLPLNISWYTPKEQGWLLNVGQVLCVFAQTNGGHSWTSSLVWEEP